MAKLTILEMVVDILNDLDSDEVNSFDDTLEASQVAQILRTTYFEIIGTRDWPHLKQLFALDNSSDIGRPSHMRLPDDLKELTFIQYNQQKTTDPTRRYFANMKYLHPDEFLHLTNQRNNTLENVDLVQDFTGVELLIFNDKHPTRWTSFDEEWVIFDAYDKEFGSTLTKANCQAFGVRNPVWNHLDNFVPDLPIEAFPTLLEEAKSTAFLVLKQMSNAKAEQKAARGQRWLARKAWVAKGGIRYPNYGRGPSRNSIRQPLDKTSVST